MNLGEFKFIYFWEYFHRLFGRLIGLVFFFPLAYLLIKKKVNRSWAKKLIIAFILGGSQGLLGWFMVKSGLVDKPDVSHFRLAAHFSLALIIMGYIYWLMMDLKKTENQERGNAYPKVYLIPFSIILIIQIIYGAFVAGLDAGMVFNTFPLMGKTFIPSIIFDGGVEMFISGNAGVQLVHRLLGMALFVFAVYFQFKSRKMKNKKEKRALLFISHMTFLQFLLGIGTLVMKVPLFLASMHQMGACFLVLFTLRGIYIFAPFNSGKTENVDLKEKAILT